MSARIKVWAQVFKNRPFPMLQWHDPETGKRKSISAGTDDPKKIEEARSDKEYELNNGLHKKKTRTEWKTFREIYERDKLAGDSERNLSKAGTVFDLFQTYFKKKTVEDIDEKVLAGFTTFLRQRKLKPVTIHGYLTYMRAALRWAAKLKYIPVAPKFDMPKIPKGSNRAKVAKASRMTTENLETMLAKSPSRGWQLVVVFAWYCGMRRGEARNVKGEDIDLERHVIRIPKNKAGDQAATAVIPRELDAILRRWYPDGIPSGPIVRGVSENLSEITRMFVEKISKPAGVVGNSKDGYATLHDLRRNFGSRWARKVPAQILQRMMRHANIQTTLEYYAETEQAAIDLVWESKPAHVNIHVTTGDNAKTIKNGETC